MFTTVEYPFLTKSKIVNDQILISNIAQKAESKKYWVS